MHAAIMIQSFVPSGAPHTLWVWCSYHHHSIAAPLTFHLYDATRPCRPQQRSDCIACALASTEPVIASLPTGPTSSPRLVLSLLPPSLSSALSDVFITA